MQQQQQQQQRRPREWRLQQRLNRNNGNDNAINCSKTTRASTSATRSLGRTVAIIGAGVSGLTCIKSCLEEGLRPVCFEASKEIGGVWVYRDDVNQNGRGRLYRSVVTNTSKEMMCFSDFPPPPHWPPFLRHEQLLRYYESYAAFYDLNSRVKTQTEVVSVEKADDHVISGRWVVTIRSTANDCQDCDQMDDYDLSEVQCPSGYEEINNCMKRRDETRSSQGEPCNDNVNEGEVPRLRRLLFDAVVVCAGILGKKNFTPEQYEGYSKFQGSVMHACQYRTPDDYVNKRVVIVGGANTAGDLAVEIGNVARQVYLSTRHGCWVVGRTASNSVPWDLATYSRFNHLFLPAWLRAKVAEKLLTLRIDHEKLGLRCDNDFLTGQKMINDDLDASILSGKVVAKPAIRSFERDDVVFCDFTRADRVDAVIFATGYQHHFPFLTASSPARARSDPAMRRDEIWFEEEEEEEEEEDPYGARKLDFYGHVFPPRESFDTLAFVGCLEPTGPVAPAIELQSRWVARVFSRRVSLPVSVWARLHEIRQDRADVVASTGHAHLLRRGYTGGWDVTPTDDPVIEALGRKSFPLLKYQEDLAARIGCRPSFWRLLCSDPKLFWHLVFGPCHPASYRLQGPHSWQGARDAILNAQKNTAAATKTRVVTATPPPQSWWIFAGVTFAFIVFICFGLLDYPNRKTEPFDNLKRF